MTAVPEARLPALQLDGVTFTYQSTKTGPTPVLDKLDFALFPGEFVAVVGPSGCGKSTVLKLASGLLRPTAGRVLLGGQAVNGTPPGVGFMFQRDALLPWRTVDQNIAVGLELAGIARQDWAAETTRLLHLVGLDGFGGYHPSALSGGMRQRVSLARTFAYRARLLLMDEPFGALDAQTKLIMGQELLRIWQTERQSVVFVTHDIEEAITLADRVVVIADRPGRIKASYTVPIPRPRDARSLRRTSIFTDLCDQVWEDLALTPVAS